MAIKGDWSNHDNKRYRGKLDRIYVSMTEHWEVEYFIDHYLESRKAEISNNNRDIISDTLEKYTGQSPYRRDDLIQYLNRVVN
jgi:hypothetical protein